MDSKKARSLLRKFNVFQTWRLGEPPFDKRPDMYSDKEVNELLDDVSEALAGYVAMCDGECRPSSCGQNGLPPGITFVNAADLINREVKKSSASIDSSARWKQIYDVAHDNGKQPPPPLPPAPFRDEASFIQDV